MPEKRRRRNRSDALLEALEPYESVVVITHDNPDPDAIASGWAIQYLISRRKEKKVRFVAGGEVVRAENREMVRLLQPPLELVFAVMREDNQALVLVDCNTESGHHLLSGHEFHSSAVIDHHQLTDSLVRLIFRDIRPHAAATASMAASYLREQGIEPDRKLATALLYGLRSETVGGANKYSRVDRTASVWLTERADPSLLSRIENAPLTRDYFADLVLALQNVFVYEDAAICFLPRASGPEILGEVADTLIRCEDIHRVLCADATRLLNQTLKGLGQGGGHQNRAGGKIPDKGHAENISKTLQQQLRANWLTACRVKEERGTRLVALREMVAELT